MIWIVIRLVSYFEKWKSTFDDCSKSSFHTAARDLDNPSYSDYCGMLLASRRSVLAKMFEGMTKGSPCEGMPD